MIPTFPQFKKLELSDREEVEKITSQFPPYSDFNFTSMWCWDVENSIEISIHKKNLIVRFTDYITGEKFFSFLGSEDVHIIINTLLKEAENENLLSVLKLIPESVVDKLNSLFLIQEDRDNFDYIYSIKDLVEYQGSRYKDMRNLLNAFLRRYETVEVRELKLMEENTQKEVLDLLQRWESNRGFEIPRESEAIRRYLSSANQFNYIAIGIYINNILAAFCFSEVLSNGYANAHFAKGDISFYGIYSFLMNAVARNLITKGCNFLNYEQDLGIPSMRSSKDNFCPDHFLKKYLILNSNKI